MAKKLNRKQQALLKREKRISFGHRQSFAMKDLEPNIVPTPKTYVIKKSVRRITEKKEYYHIFSKEENITARFKDIEYRYCGYPLIKKYVINKYKLPEYVFDIVMFLAPIEVFTKFDFEFFLYNLSGLGKKTINTFIGMGIVSQPHELENNPNNLYKLSKMGYDIVNDFFFYMNRFHEFGTKDYLEKKQMIVGFQGDENLHYYRSVIEEIHNEIKKETISVNKLRREMNRVRMDDADKKFIEIAYFYFKQSSIQISEITGFSSFVVRSYLIEIKAGRKRNGKNDLEKFDTVKKLWQLHLKRKIQ